EDMLFRPLPFLPSRRHRWLATFDWSLSRVPHLAVPRRLLIVALVALVSVGSTVGRGQESNTKSAQTSVDAWLALVDAERYGDSWDTAASIFRAALPRDAWLTAVQNPRIHWAGLKRG